VYDAAEILRDPAFFRFLLSIDVEFAGQARREGCRHCSGPLHVSDFPRKPRGCPASVVEDYSWRFSFTCGHCEQRTTSQSVRFVSRRIYVAVVLMLSSPPQGRAAQSLRDQLSIPARTVQRWRKWWTSDFSRTPFWQAMRKRFMPPVAGEQLPASLLDRFDAADLCERLTQALRFLAPLSISPVSLCEGRVLSRRGCR
jgi:hypothetical protein